ncbi:hypothetical protein H8S95_06355 [Pontibacter sp. KCTC 32443]|uniref:hypothetical protein n=1 Tax=Pontibacter TaxID=323449 RepID=UPI00164E8966|nr:MULTISPECIES: hypothetical protein [Pontibacter]MBC5773677.1 hypothetical protein [Pontibacter sp. KCTC 32443]
MLFTDEDHTQEKPEQELKEAKSREQHQSEGWRQKKMVPCSGPVKHLCRFITIKKTRDLSDKSRDEEDLTRKYDEQVSTNRDLDNFIYAASHALKAPILNIDG